MGDNYNPQRLCGYPRIPLGDNVFQENALENPSLSARWIDLCPAETRAHENPEPLLDEALLTA